jgi:hypothetical protein
MTLFVDGGLTIDYLRRDSLAAMTKTMANDPTVDDAIGAIIDQLRTKPTELRNYGYDVYLPLVWNNYAIASEMVLAGDRYALDRVGPLLSPTFYAAVWELCRRGLLRPSVRNVTGQSGGGNGQGVRVASLSFVTGTT